jgi:hypothetical protein
MCYFDLLPCESIQGQKLDDFPGVWLSLSILQVLANLFFGFTGPYVMQTIVLLSTAIFGVNLLLDFNRIYAEKQDLEKGSSWIR